MKKLNTLLILCIVLLCIGCQNNSKSTDEKGTNQSVLSEMQNKENEDFDYKEQAVDYEIYDTTWEEETYTFTGEYLEITFEVKSMPVAEFSLLVYIDGILTPYYSNEDSTVSNSHVFKTLKEEEKKSITIYFKPVYGEKGKEYDLNVVLLDNPNYMLTDTSWSSFQPNHGITEISMKKVKFESEGVDNNNIDTEYTIKPLENVVEESFNNDYAKGGNNLNEGNFRGLFEQSFDYENKCFTYPRYFSVKKDEKLKIYLPFLGEDGEYTVSLYINHELIPAFDGKEYLDVDIKRDKYAEKVIELDVSKYSGPNHIYMIAVKKTDYDVSKSSTLLLEIVE